MLRRESVFVECVQQHRKEFLAVLLVGKDNTSIQFEYPMAEMAAHLSVIPKLRMQQA